MQYKTNSLLLAALTGNRDPSIIPNRSLQSWPSRKSLNSLSTISALYIYTNPPPMGYGTPAPKVAESVLRAYSYNRNPPDRRERKIDNFNVNVPYWLGNPSEFPFHQIHGNFHVGEAHGMFKAQLIQNFENIKIIYDNVINHLLLSNSSILTKGRQTWCPLMEQSLPSALAYKNMSGLFEMNLHQKATNCVEWIRCFFLMTELSVITYNEYRLEKRIKIITDKVTKEKVRKVKDIRVPEQKTIVGKEECYKFMLDLARSFCSYIKHGERGKLQRRAIASANMILRMFLYAVEEFHLQLSKLIPGASTM